MTGPPAREGSTILDTDGNKVCPKAWVDVRSFHPYQIGEVTSGTFSPTLSRPIAMGYVQTAFSKSDTVVQTEVRNKINEAIVVP